MESGIQLKESGILLTIGIQNPSSTDKESEIQNLESRIQDCLGFPLTWGKRNYSNLTVQKRDFIPR